MKRMLLFLCLLTTSLLHGEGFIAGTLVKTPTGYTPIEELKIGDTVICFDLKGSCLEKKVTYTHQKHVTRFLIITVNNKEIIVADDHTFYIPSEEKWVIAEELKIGHVLFKNCLEQVTIDQIQEIPVNDSAYDITVDEYHNFCVTQEDIIVHNVIPLFAWGAGQGLAFVGWKAVGLGILNTLGGIGSKLFVNGAFKKLFGSSGRARDYEEFNRLYDLSIPDKPGDKDGYKPPKNSDGEKQPHPETDQHGWPDKDGNYWVPSGPHGHAGPHWDIINPGGKRIGNIYPGGYNRPPK